MIPLDEIGLCTFLAAFVRCYAWMFTSPLTSDHMVPPKVRAAAAVLFAAAIAPVRHPVLPSEMVLAIPGELLIGLCFGYTTKLLLAAIEAGGQLIGLELELGFAGTLDPIAKEEALPTRRLAYVIAALTYVSLGGIEAAVRAVALTTVDGRTLQHAIASVISASGDVMIVALRIAAPLMIATLIANLAMAVASRAAPALNVFSVMLALVLGVGGVLLLATAPAFTREVTLHVGRLDSALSRIAGR